MGKWTLGLILVLLACLPIFLHRSNSPGLLQDTDTRVLLETLRQRDDPLSWFAGDWPLGNHFYRPVSTLTFELDQRTWRSNAAGYGLTNSVLCILCVFALYWFLRELTGKLEIALPAAVLFAFWHVGFADWIAATIYWLSYLLIITIFLPGRSWKKSILAFFVLLFLSGELWGKAQLGPRMIEWLPGRTASVMTLFVLLALSSYARYERISATQTLPSDPGPLEPPATKGTEITGSSKSAWLWPLFAIAFLSLALGSYEQAVMAPALLFGTALYMRLQGYRVRWFWQVAFWGVLVGYLVLRSQLVPTDVSGYQAQQFRSGPGVWSSILDYVFPGAMPLWFGVAAYDPGLMFEEGGIIGALMALPFVGIVAFGASLFAAVASRNEWKLPLAGFVMSSIAFLPMAWLKHFDHYHYLPMALRAFFVVAIGGIAGRAVISAVSRPTLQAPARLDPAPGSLLRP